MKATSHGQDWSLATLAAKDEFKSSSRFPQFCDSTVASIESTGQKCIPATIKKTAKVLHSFILFTSYQLTKISFDSNSSANEYQIQMLPKNHPTRIFIIKRAESSLSAESIPVRAKALSFLLANFS